MTLRNLPSGVRVNNRRNQVIGHIRIICQQLLGVLWQVAP